MNLHSAVSSSASSARVALLLCFPFLAILVAGCSSTQHLRIVTEPPGALVRVTDPKHAPIFEKTAPAQLEVSFPDANSTYRLEATKTEYEPATSEVGASDYDKLPAVGEQTREIKLTLRKVESVIVNQLVVVYSPQQGFVGARRRVRAYFDTTEQGGRVPTLIVDLPEGHGIRGLAISGDGTRFAFAEATADEKTVVAPGDNNVIRLSACDLKSMTFGSQATEQLTREGFKDIDPAADADGKHLLFVSNRRRTNRADLLRIL
jgi:hypothetical protein